MAFLPNEGLLQRLGLAVGDGWLVASAVAILRGLLGGYPTVTAQHNWQGARVSPWIGGCSGA